MYKRYHIETASAKLAKKIGKFRIRRDDTCLNCGRCIQECIYGVHKRDPLDLRLMAEPEDTLCKNCFACIQNCPRQALSMHLNQEYEELGNDYWTPEGILTIWNEAEEGKIPVYGAGYRGRFGGSGFDGIWTDMSEIVRPTRDGIHGREYISTVIDLGRKLSWISDFQKLDAFRCHEAQIPLLLEANPLRINSKKAIRSVVEAASQLETFVFLDVEDYFGELRPYLKSIALRFSPSEHGWKILPALEEVNFLEVVLPTEFETPDLEAYLGKLRSQNPQALISLGIHDPRFAPELIHFYADGTADVLTLSAGAEGRCGEGGLFITKAIQAIHHEFVRKSLRDEVTLIARGGIAAAEHVPKIIICGADAAVVDLALLVALGCRVCPDCEPERCPVEIREIAPDFARQRILNLACAWRDQLLEVLGAMGIRDVRRLRGEAGRAMFYEIIEKESFDYLRQTQ